MDQHTDTIKDDVSLTPVAQATNMEQWFSTYVFDDESQPGEIPALTTERLKRQFGDGDSAEQLRRMSETLLFLDDEDYQSTLALYLCGYPEKSIAMLGMVDLELVLAKIDELLPPPVDSVAHDLPETANDVDLANEHHDDSPSVDLPASVSEGSQVEALDARHVPNGVEQRARYLSAIVGDLDGMDLESLDSAAVAEALTFLGGVGRRRSEIESNLSIHPLSVARGLGGRARINKKALVRDFFDGVSFDEMAARHDSKNATAVYALLHDLSSTIRGRYDTSSAARIFKERLAGRYDDPGVNPNIRKAGHAVILRARVAPSPAIDTVPLRYFDKHVVHESDDLSEELLEQTDAVAIFSKTLKFNAHGADLLNQLLDPSIETVVIRKSEEIKLVARRLGTYINENFGTLSNPRLRLNQAQRKAVTTVLGWVNDGQTVRFQEPTYARNYVRPSAHVDYDLVDAVESGLKRVAIACDQHRSESA